MNLQKLFEMQAQLDADITAHHPVQEGENRLEKKVLALLVELGECAQEWRGFKFWSNRQTANELEWINEDCKSCKGTGVDVEGVALGNPYPCIECEGKSVVAYSKNPLIEEYVDCLHFILSIGNEKVPYLEHQAPIHLELPFGSELEKTLYKDATTQFVYLFNIISIFADTLMENEVTLMSEAFDEYTEMFKAFLGLGELLGFTDGQIEQAYYDKNKVNFKRQEQGY